MLDHENIPLYIVPNIDHSTCLEKCWDKTDRYFSLKSFSHQSLSARKSHLSQEILMHLSTLCRSQFLALLQSSPCPIQTSNTHNTLWQTYTHCLEKTLYFICFLTWLLLVIFHNFWLIFWKRHIMPLHGLHDFIQHIFPQPSLFPNRIVLAYLVIADTEFFFAGFLWIISKYTVFFLS